MMNVIAFSLLFSSLVFAGVWSPTPPQPSSNQKQDVLQKGGHRAVLIEYADTAGGDGETKVLISPSTPGSGLKHPIDTAEDQLSSAAASVAGVAEQATTGPKDLICDAYGRCKEKISGAFHMSKDKVSDGAHDVQEGADNIRGAAHRAKEAVEGGAQEVVDKAKDTTNRAKEAAEGGARQAVDKTKETAHRAKETIHGGAAKIGEKAKEAAQSTIDKSKQAAEHVSDKISDVKDEAVETAKKIGETGEKAKKEFSDIARRGEEVIYDVFAYIFSTETVNSLTNVVQMLGFATAYGVSIWVTFIMSHVLASVLPRQQFGMVQSKIYPVYFKVTASGIAAALIGHILGQRRKLFDDNNRAGLVQGYNLLSSLIFVLANLLILEPRASKVMFERMKLEKEEGRGRESTFIEHQTPRRVVDTFVTTETAGGPVTTDGASGAATSPTPATVPAPATVSPEQLAIRSKMQNLGLKLKKLNSYSSVINVLALMGLTWHLLYLSQRLASTPAS